MVQLMDVRTDNLSESENTETQVTSEVEPETDMESPEILEKASSDVKKDNTNETIKRGPSTKRTSNSIISSSAKVSTSSINRNAVPSKPLSKAASLSSARRSNAQSTAPSVRYTSSAYSSGGSGDEKRKSLVSATRRTSLTPIPQHQPLKVESLAEKRGISGVAARKPAISSNNINPKPIARSNSIASKSSSVVKRSSSINTKSSTSGSLSDSTKRLSTAPGSVIAAKPLARNSSISTEVDRLKDKLELSTTKIDDQEKEIKATRENLDKLSKQLEEEIHKSALTEENLKIEHREKVEKLGIDYETKFQILKSELEKPQAAVVDAQEISARVVEEALQKEALKNASTIQELKDGFESTLSSLKTQLTETNANCASLASKLLEKETEIQSLNSQIIESDEQQKILKQEHEMNISNLRRSLLEEKEAVLSTLRAEFDELALKQDNQIKSIHNKEIAALTEKYELKINELQTILDNTKASLTEAEETYKKTLETNFRESENNKSHLESKISQLKSELEAKLASLLASEQSRIDLEEKCESLYKNFQETKEDYLSLSEQFTAINKLNSTYSQDLETTRDHLSQVQANLTKQMEMMSIFNDDGKNKDELYKKKQIELEAATKKINEIENEIANFKQQIEEFEKTSLSHKKTIAKLQKELAVKEEAITKNNEQVEQDEHLKNLLSDKSRELNEAENNYKNQLSLLENKIEDLNNKLSKTQDKLVTNQQYLAQEKIEKAQALAELDAFQNRKTDTIETNNLNSKQQELKTREEAENDQITKKAFEQYQKELVIQQEESENKYLELKLEMTRLVEEANQKVTTIESRLKESEALLKLKDAEISETKIASSQDGIIYNKLTSAEMKVSEENEGEQDNSSTALASLAQAMVLAHQVTQMINEFQNDIFGPLRTLAETTPKTICSDDNFTQEI